MNRRKLLMTLSAGVIALPAIAAPGRRIRFGRPTPITLTYSFGNKTRSGHGGAPSGNTAGSAITGTGASDWVIDDEGDVVPSGTYGAYKASYSASYALTLANGTLVNITMVANRADVKWKNNAALSNVDNASDFQLRTLLNTASASNGAMVYGDTIIVRAGIQNNVSSRSLGFYDMRIRPPLNGYGGTPGGWIKIKADTPVNLNSVLPGACRMTRIKVDGVFMTSGTLDVGLWWEGFDAMYPGGNTTTGPWGGAASAAGLLQRMYFTSNRIHGAVPNGTYLQNASGINLSGVAEYVSIVGNVFHDLYNPIIIAGASPVITGNYFVRFFNDGVKLGPANDPLLQDNILIGKLNAAASSHGDFMQESNTATLAGAHVGGLYSRNMLVSGITTTTDSQSGQGVFSDDEPVTAYFTDKIVEKTFVLNANKTNGILLTNVHDMIIRWSGTFREPVSSTNPAINPAGITNGLIVDCVTQSAGYSTYTPSGGGGSNVPTTNGVLTRVTQISPTNALTWAQILAVYQTMFLSPSFGADNGITSDVPTTSEIITKSLQVKQNWSPVRDLLVANGGAMNPDGTYRGAFFPKNMDGSVDWNDGTVYVYH